MITGAHILFYSQDPEADRAFFRNILGFHSVDVGHGWLIFALPSAEAAIHLTDTDFSQTHAGQKLLGAVLYLMCDDLKAQIATLAEKGVHCSEIQEASWGISTCIPLPGGRALGLYQPSHETAINLNSKH
jgi:catechol 2,3-dioxygenase-like lactoylglutathione lyase family enzyme